mmetsp:Transcript_14609/g.35215  ORF Transcript_14609/g.35215 Transcript_14609/m.35215 type:complete len:253 (-) Transcript_14609:126-884(-)
MGTHRCDPDDSSSALSPTSSLLIGMLSSPSLLGIQPSWCSMGSFRSSIRMLLRNGTAPNSLPQAVVPNLELECIDSGRFSMRRILGCLRSADLLLSLRKLSGGDHWCTSALVPEGMEFQARYCSLCREPNMTTIPANKNVVGLTFVIVVTMDLNDGGCCIILFGTSRLDGEDGGVNWLWECEGCNAWRSDCEDRAASGLSKLGDEGMAVSAVEPWLRRWSSEEPFLVLSCIGLDLDEGDESREWEWETRRRS